MNKYLLDLKTFPSDARHAWRTDGARGVWSEIAERSLFRIVRLGHYDLYDRELSSITYYPPPADIEVRMLAPHEHEQLGALMTRRRRAQLARDPADRTVFVATRDGAVVGFSWWTSTFDTPHDFSPLVLPADAVFHGYVHVEKSERHRGVSTAIFSAGEMYFHERGTRSCWFLVKSTNTAGARAARGRWGGSSRHIARLGYLKVASRTRRTLTLIDAE